MALQFDGVDDYVTLESITTIVRINDVYDFKVDERYAAI